MKKLTVAATMTSLAFAACPASALSWTRVPGQATQTLGSLAANVTDTWVIGTNAFNSDGNQVYQWNGKRFEGRQGGAIRLALPADNTFGQPWAITASSQLDQGPIKMWDGSSFVVPPNGFGCARSLAVSGPSGPDCVAYVISCDPPVNSNGDRTIYRYEKDLGWQITDGAGVQIAIDGGGNPWVINSQGTVYRGSPFFNGSTWSNRWEPKVPGGGIYVAVGLASLDTAERGKDIPRGTLLGLDHHIYAWMDSPPGWLDQGPGNPDFTMISANVYGYWALDGLGYIWVSPP